MLDLRKYLIPGQNALVRRVIQPADTAGNYTEALTEFMATPAWVDMAIRAAVDAVDKHLPTGYITVGTRVDLTHEAPTRLGMTVTVGASLREIAQDKRLIFEIRAWDEIGEIGKGILERNVVNLEALHKKAMDRWQFASRQQA